jgi:hypothetical protein
MNATLGRGFILILIIFVAVAVVAIVNHIGVRITGDVMAWRQWMRNHALHFFIWRLFVYGSAAYGWWRMRQRKLSRDPSPQARQQMLRTEISMVVFVVLFEVRKWLSQP